MVITDYIHIGRRSILISTVYDWRVESQQVEAYATRQEPLFANCRSRPTYFGCYRHESKWYLCRIRSHDCNGTFTIIWEDGTLQIGTTTRELRRPSRRLSVLIENELERIRSNQTLSLGGNDKSLSGICPALPPTFMDYPEYKGMTVWEAAKKGDLEAVLYLIDQGLASPNDVEMLDRNTGEGRTPLYWACFGGHVKMVRELLSRGGNDWDDSAYLAVTTREKADDNRDLLFDPDTNTFSDWIDYPVTKDETMPLHISGSKRTTTTTSAPSVPCSADDRALIRAMLAAAKSAPSRAHVRARLPQRLYIPEQECSICLERKDLWLIVPCGHVSTCLECLQSVQRKREGCPLCRGRIVATVPHRTQP